MHKLFGIPNCDTVKKARTFLDSLNLDYDFIDFKKTPPTKALILEWEKAFGLLPVNTKGLTYKKYKDEFEALSKAEKITFLTTHSSMIKRPILQKKDSVLAFGFSPEEYKAKLGK
jgi:arsenate reductase (glutaredoxin)